MAKIITPGDTRFPPKRRMKVPELIARIVVNLRLAPQQSTVWQAFAVVCEVEGYEPRKVLQAMKAVGYVKLEDHGKKGAVIVLTQVGLRAANVGTL